MRGQILAAAVASLLQLAAEAQMSWTEEFQVQRRLAVGEVVVRSTLENNESSAHVSAAIRIKACPQEIWDVMTNCESALTFVPGLKRCRRLDRAADGSWEVIEHEVKYTWLLPAIHYVFRAEYHRPYRINIQQLSGDLKDQHGTWLLEVQPGGATTVVEYELYVEPGFWVPKALVSRSLRKDLPAMLTALRTRVESADSGIPAATTPHAQNLCVGAVVRQAPP